VNTANQGHAPADIFQRESMMEPKPLAPPEYRKQALRFIINFNRDKGVSSLSFSDLVLQVRDLALRPDIDPSFEPFSLESINAAVADLIQTRELLVVNDRTVIFPESSGPVG